jgi:DNA polymerase-3 subunit delta'
LPLLQLYGHDALRDRFRDAVRRNALPGSLLFQGLRGVGKQQLALWVARLLLCEHADAAPCEKCKSCRMAAALHHPDLHWFFPRPRPKGDFDIDDVREDMAGEIEKRMAGGGLYKTPGGDEAIFVTSTLALVQTAVMSPAMGHRKVFVVGDAERMASQEGSEQAANAFLKLLEEPPADTTIILTSSEAGALLPTIRSRVVSVRVGPLRDDEVRAFLANPTVADNLDFGGSSVDDLVRDAGGAPGRIISREEWGAAMTQARRIIEAATAPDRASRMRVALLQGGMGARGKFSDTLDALTQLLHERARSAARSGNERGASGASRAVEAVERAKELAYGNVNPQLLASSLLAQIAGLVG